MRIAGSFPRLPQRLMVRGETRKIFATSRTVSKSGHWSPSDIIVVTSGDATCFSGARLFFYISFAVTTVQPRSNVVKRDQRDTCGNRRILRVFEFNLAYLFGLNIAW